jgi:2-C-methyl-D-erythritol 4-phosphate cytidylyltransferase
MEKNNNLLNIVLIVAAGSGKRMKTRVKKQFLDLLGKPILIRTIEKFSQMESIDYIYLVLAEKDMEFFKKELFPKYLAKNTKLKAIIQGGKERFFSVFNGIKVINSQFENQKVRLLIHDGVRPFVDEILIKSLLREVGHRRGSVPGIEVKDTIRLIDDNSYLEGYLERSKLRALQTPQCFYLKDIYEAYAEAMKKSFVPSDDTAVFLSLGYAVKVVNGYPYNIKITTPEDLILAENFLQLERDFYNVY